MLEKKGVWRIEETTYNGPYAPLRNISHKAVKSLGVEGI